MYVCVYVRVFVCMYVSVCMSVRHLCAGTQVGQKRALGHGARVIYICELSCVDTELRSELTSSEIATSSSVLPSH